MRRFDCVGGFAGRGTRGRQGATRKRASVAFATAPSPVARHGRRQSPRPRAAHRHSRPKQRFTPSPVPGRLAPRRRRRIPSPIRRERPSHPARARARFVRDSYPVATFAPHKHSIRQVRVPCGRHFHCYTTAAVLRIALTGSLQ